MTFRVLLGVGDPALERETAALLGESGEFDIAGTASTSDDVESALDRLDVDVVLMHEDLGPVPVLELVRGTVARHPEVAVVLIVRAGTAAVLTAAMESGARGVVTTPLSLEELLGRLTPAAQWARSVRRHLSGEAAATPEARGRMVALAGAKGGTGTTTVAVHLALAAAAATGRRVCLVDLDLQTGDVANLLAVTHHRSIVDLLDVADELSPRSLEEALFAHASGLRVLLSPREGERAEDVRADAARQVLAGLRARFDLVFVDVGSVMNEAGLVAVELADEVVVVVTPDVPCLRAARRLIRLWTRLVVRKETEVRVLANRVSRGAEVQPDLMRKVVGAPVLRTTLPAAFKQLERPLNTAAPDRLEDGTLRRELRRLAAELMPAGPPAAPEHQGRRSLEEAVLASPGERESGSTTLEGIAVLGLVLVLAAALWQAALTGYTLVLASHAADEAAHEAALHQPPLAAVERDLPGAWRSGARVDSDGHRVTVHLGVPIVFPGLTTGMTVQASAASVPE